MREMTDDERKARQARYARESRARKAQERAAAVAAAAADAKPGEMAAALESSLSAMKWLAASDGAAVALARLEAKQLDALLALNTAAAASLALRLQAQLLRLLDSLGGTPRVRMQHELRSRAIAVDEQIEAAPNVSRFTRPTSRLARPERHRRGR
jgi:hypothetical protein